MKEDKPLPKDCRRYLYYDDNNELRSYVIC